MNCFSKPIVDVKHCSELPSVRRAIKRKACATQWTSTAGVTELKKVLHDMGFEQPSHKCAKARNRVYVAEQRVSVASEVCRLVCRLIWRPVPVGGAFLLLISSASELSQTESVTAKSLVGLSNG